MNSDRDEKLEEFWQISKYFSRCSDSAIHWVLAGGASVSVFVFIKFGAEDPSSDMQSWNRRQEDSLPLPTSRVAFASYLEHLRLAACPLGSMWRSVVAANNGN